MNREDVDLHKWTRVGTTRDHYSMANPGENYSTVPVVCMHCREYRPDMAVSLLEGTTGSIPPEYWPGRCNLAAGEPVDAAWVAFETANLATLGPIGRGLLKAVGQAMAGAFLAFALLQAFGDVDWADWTWVPASAVFALGAGIISTVSEPKKKSTTKRKG